MKYITFRINYFLFFVFIFIAEVLIAKFLHDQFIRPFLGDVLVVILIFCFFKSLFNISTRTIAFGVLVFSCLIEFLQLFHPVKLLHLENNTILRIMLGSVFDYKDLFAYFIGYLICLKMK